MLKILQLEFKNIGRFQTLQTLDFSKFPNLTLVDGKNNNTGGSSGAAKSTTFHALDYLWGINDVPATALQSRLTKDLIWVRGTIDKDGTVLRITRGKKEGLVIERFENDEFNTIVSGNNKIAEEHLKTIIGIPLDLFSLLTHQKQTKGGFFLNLTPKAAYNFLSECLGLSENTSKIQKLTEKYKVTTKNLEDISTQILIEQGNLKTLNEVKGLKVIPNESIDLELKKTYKDEIESLSQTYVALKEELTSEINKLTKPIEITTRYDETNLSDLTKKKEKLTLAHMKCLTDKNDRVNVFKGAIAKIDKELGTIATLEIEKRHHLTDLSSTDYNISQLLENKCPECGQKVIKTDLLEKYRAQQNRINANIFKLDEIMSNKSILLDKKDKITDAMVIERDDNTISSRIYNNISIVNSLIKEENEKKDTFNLGISQKNIQLWTTYNKDIASIRRKYDNKIDKNQEEINNFKNLYNDLCRKEHAMQTTKKLIENEIKEISDRIAQVDAKVLRLLTRQSELQKEQLVISESIRLVKSYVLHIFEGSLSYISDLASKFLSSIPTMTNCYIYFDTKYETQSGEIRDEITAYINLESDERIPIKTLSGGERMAVDLAIDLAVRKMIEEYSNNGCDYLLLDEPFCNMDAIGSSMCLQLLNENNYDKKILVIDHGSELKSAINNVILIERTGESSEIKIRD
jgi:DNA repair exonuclease SbcCD ATPase subunit